jgi:shikimate kinase
MAIVLIGVPGAGKTTVGSLLAQSLKYEFIDTDQLIEQQLGKSISDIFIQDGEEFFRKIEAQVIASALKNELIVVSVGGGALMNTHTRDLIKSQTAIWLQAGLSQAVDRVGMNKNRPLLLGNVRGQLADLMAAREPFYIECAKLVVDTNDLSPQEVVEEIEKQLAGVS